VPELRVRLRSARTQDDFRACRGVCSAVPDTGTTRSIVGASVLESAGISYDPAGAERVTTANGDIMKCLGNVLLDMDIEGTCLVVDALVAQRLHSDLLISWQDLQRFGIISPSFPRQVHPAEPRPRSTRSPLRPAHARSARAPATPSLPSSLERSGVPPASLPETIESIAEEFADVFDETQVSPMKGAPMKIQMRRGDPGYRPLRISAPRRVPLHFQQEADKDLKWFLDSGVIVPVPEDEQTEWCSPGFFVPKPNGKVRLVVDYREINKFIDRPVHPFPSPRDVVRGILPSSRFFMKLDAVQGYYQVPLDEASSRLTTFLLPSGRYRFMRAPMGMNSSSDGFCMRTDLIFNCVPKVQKIVDDALLQAETLEELCANFRLACTAARKHNLTLSRPKLCYGPKIHFAGYIISDQGVQPDPTRLAAVSEFPAPTDLTSLRAFLGLVNQLGFFVPDLAHMTNPLRLLLKKGTAWIWLPDHQHAFEQVKHALIASLVVQPFDPDLKTELLTDASRLKGLGYALIQRDAQGNLRLVQCSSRSLSPAETRYATIELECLAIQWAIADCRYYLLGCTFRVLTDHRPLVGIFDKPLADLANTRLLRIRLKLTDYRFSVEWTPGKTHCIADALSRAPIFDPPEPLVAEQNEVLAMARATRPADPALDYIYEAASSDENYRKVLAALQAGVHERNLHPDHPAAPYKKLWPRMGVRHDTIITLDYSRIIVPQAARRPLLEKLHYSHPGILRTLQLARQFYYWPGMSNDITSVVAKCEACQLTRPSKPHTEPPRSYPAALFPMHYVSLDLFACAGKEYLVMVDRFSGYTWVHPLSRETTAAIIRPLEAWFYQYGFPENILSDNGPCFRSEFKLWCKSFHIIPDNSSPYHSESNGLAESAVKRTKHLLQKCTTFQDFVARHFEQRNVPTAGMDTSPAERFFNRRQRGCLPILSDHRENAAGSDVQPDFAVGDQVRIQDPISKLWDSIGMVIEIRPTKNSYLIRRDEGADLVRNRRFLKRLPHVLWRDHPINRFEPEKAAPASCAPSGRGSVLPAGESRLPAGAERLHDSRPRLLASVPRGSPPPEDLPPLRRSTRLEDKRQRAADAVQHSAPDSVSAARLLVSGSGTEISLPPSDRQRPRGTNVLPRSSLSPPRPSHNHVPVAVDAEGSLGFRGGSKFGFSHSGNPCADGVGRGYVSHNLPYAGRSHFPVRQALLPLLARASAASTASASGSSSLHFVAAAAGNSDSRLKRAAAAAADDASEPADAAAKGHLRVGGPTGPPPFKAFAALPSSAPGTPSSLGSGVAAGPVPLSSTSGQPARCPLRRRRPHDSDSALGPSTRASYADVVARGLHLRV